MFLEFSYEVERYHQMENICFTKSRPGSVGRDLGQNLRSLDVKLHG